MRHHQCEEVKQAQREAKEDAEPFVAEEERPDTQQISEERSVGRSYIPSDIGTDIDDEDAGVCPDNPEEDADAIHLLQVKAICVDEAGEASYLSGFIGVVLYSKYGRCSPTTRQMWSRSQGKKADYTVPKALHLDQREGRLDFQRCR